MNIKQILEDHGISIDSIYRIYHGKDHECRCGCHGRYFEKDTIGFKRVLSKISKDNFQPLSNGVDMWHSQAKFWGKTTGIEVGDCYVNIPYNAEKDMCYTLYFA